MVCPVCDRPAEEIHAPQFKGRVVRCSHCREFAASSDALDRLASVSFSARQEALRAARQLAVRRRVRPVIDASAFEPQPVLEGARA